jgi:hypothetical protein
MGHAVCVGSSKIGAFASPFVVGSSLNDFSLGVILGIMNVLAALAAYCLPETSGIRRHEHRPIHSDNEANVLC